MIKKIKDMLVVSVSLLTLAAPMLVPVAAVAAAQACDTDTVKGSVGSGVDAATGTPELKSTCKPLAGDGTDGIQPIAKKVVNLFSIIVGITAVIFVILGGFKYITSGGDSGKVGSAKSTLIYALVGLVIVALSQLIVRFVLTSATTAAGA